MTKLIDSRMLHKAKNFFTKEVTIQKKVVPPVKNQYGQVVETWEDIPGLENLKAAMAAIEVFREVAEWQANRYTVTTNNFYILFAGYYPQITTSHRAVVDGQVYDIDGTESDQTGSMTRIRVSLVEV